MKIAITYNADTHLKPHLNEVERLGEDEVAESARDVYTALAASHQCELFPVGDCIAGALLAIRDFAPDVVFNLCEGVLGRTRWEAHFVLALDLLGIPYCGCDAVTIALTQDKGFIKQLLRQIGVPTPEGLAVAPGCLEGQVLADIAAMLARAPSGRVIVKPIREDGGIGVDATCVVDDAADALERCRGVWRQYHQPALVEAFIDGKEYNLALYAGQQGVVTLPPGEIVFAPSLQPEARVVGWKAKWNIGSVEDLSTQSRIVPNLEPALHAEITATCRHVAAMMGMSGYCRFDLRQGPDGRINIIDINANPDIGPDSGFRKALAAADIRFEDFLAELISARLQGRRESWRSAA
jgi:D-alanine-D-alanine ligase